MILRRHKSVSRGTLVAACSIVVLTGTLALAQMVPPGPPTLAQYSNPVTDQPGRPAPLPMSNILDRIEPPIYRQTAFQSTVEQPSGNISQPAPLMNPALDDPLSHFNGPVALDTLIAYARANNPEIAAARFNARRLAARVPQVESLPDPKLITNAFLQQIQTAAGPQEAALSLSQLIPWYGKRSLRGQSASFEAMAAYSRVTSSELIVIERVKNAYYEIIFAQAAIAENQRWRKPLEDVIALARTRYETGASPGGLERVLQAQTELSQLKTDIIQLEETRRSAQARLAGTLHLPPSTAILPVASVARNRIEKTVEILVELADSHQPLLESYRRRIASDRALIHLAERDYWPDVTVGANWYSIGDGGLSPVSNGQDAFSLGVGINLPIYRARLDASLREAKYQMCATTQEYIAARDRFHTEVQTLYAKFREHHRTLTILEKEIVPRAEQTLTLILEAYRTGRVEFQQLMDVYRSLVRYRIDLHRRIALREQALASLEKTVGCAITSPSDPIVPPAE